MRQPDPRVKDGTYYSGYWRKAYVVLEIKSDTIRVRWDDGLVTEHCTPWNPTSDEIVQVTA